MFPYLQDDPVALLGSQIHALLGHDLLALAQGHVVEVLHVEGEAQFLAQGLHVLQRVHAGGEDEEDGGGGVRLLVRVGKRDLPPLHVLVSQLLLDEVSVHDEQEFIFQCKLHCSRTTPY